MAGCILSFTNSFFYILTHDIHSTMNTETYCCAKMYVHNINHYAYSLEVKEFFSSAFVTSEATSGVHIWQTSPCAHGSSGLGDEAKFPVCFWWVMSFYCYYGYVQIAMLHNLMLLIPQRKPEALFDPENQLLFCKKMANILQELCLFRERLCSVTCLQMEWCCFPKGGYCC